MALTVQRYTVDESLASMAQQDKRRQANGKFVLAADKHINSLMRHFAAHAAMAAKSPPAAEKSAVAELESALVKLLSNVKGNFDTQTVIDAIVKALQKIVDGKTALSEATGGQCDRSSGYRSEQPYILESSVGNTTEKMKLMAALISQLIDALLKADKSEAKQEEENKRETRKPSPFEARQNGRIPACGTAETSACGVPDNSSAVSEKSPDPRDCKRPRDPNHDNAAERLEVLAELVTVLILAIAPLLAKSNNDGTVGANV